MDRAIVYKLATASRHRHTLNHAPDHLSWKWRPTALSIFWLTTSVNRMKPGEMDLWDYTPRKKNVNQEVVEC